jgi:hypothetical protein
VCHSRHAQLDETQSDCRTIAGFLDPRFKSLPDVVNEGSKLIYKLFEEEQRRSFVAKQSAAYAQLQSGAAASARAIATAAAIAVDPGAQQQPGMV